MLLKEEKIDILVNNAGVMACPKTLTEDGLEMQIGTNHFGHFLLTELLLPLVKKSAESGFHPRYVETVQPPVTLESSRNLGSISLNVNPVRTSNQILPYAGSSSCPAWPTRTGR